MRAFLATSNPGKVREMRAILDGSGIELETVPLFLGDEETGATYLENATLKAAAAVRLLAAPTLSEDAGLEADALGGLPGPRSARFAGPLATDDENNGKLLRLLAGVPAERRTARYRAVAVLMLPSGNHVHGEGIFEGRIAEVPMGEGGFGYDPLFVPAGYDRTAAQITPEEKNAISHRARALRQLVVRARESGIL